MLYKKGSNGYALYQTKGAWRESATVRNTDLVAVTDSMIGISGALNHGKDTLHELINEHSVDIPRYRIAFGDAPKRMLLAVFPMWTDDHFNDRTLKERVCPYYGVSPRKAMTTFATDWMRNMLSVRRWINEADVAIHAAGLHYSEVTITDVRFDNEAEWVLSNGGVVVRLVDPRKPINTDEESEKGISEHLITISIVNDGTLQDLVDKVKELKHLYFLPK